MINCSNFMMDLYELFKDTHLGEKIAKHAKSILLKLMGVSPGGAEEITKWSLVEVA